MSKDREKETPTETKEVKIQELVNAAKQAPVSTGTKIKVKPEKLKEDKIESDSVKAKVLESNVSEEVTKTPKPKPVVSNKIVYQKGDKFFDANGNEV